jgi:hypothetical protein
MVYSPERAEEEDPWALEGDIPQDGSSYRISHE